MTVRSSKQHKILYGIEALKRDNQNQMEGVLSFWLVI